MKTISTTRWIDEKTTDIDEVERLFLSTHPDEHPEVGPGYSNWQITKLFPDNKKDIFNGREIEYNFYTYSVDKTSAGMM
ncbi:MAG: hypothetical protein IKB95_02290, partial [Bacteroidales bacterium]|nr:hypothetical protein [Bacteroidales bacterium]